ncbi:unnamed protein product [Diamesa serratosioi]
MDIEDLFDFNDEDFLVSCTQIGMLLIADCRYSVLTITFLLEIENTEKTVPSVESPIRYSYFECSGENSINSLNDRLSNLNQDIEVLFTENGNFTAPRSFEIFNFTFEDDFLDDDDSLEHLLNMTRTNIQKLHLTSFESTEHQGNLTPFNIRSSVTKFLQILRSCYQDLTNDHLRKIRLALGTMDSMPSFTLIHSAYSALGNESVSSSHHLLHGELEWRWIYLTIIYQFENSKNLLHYPESEFKCELKLLIFDLLTLSISKFNKCNNATVIFNTPFICHCVKEMWILVHKMMLYLQDESLNFWFVFGSILNNLQEGRNPHEEYPSKLILLRSSENITCKNFHQFSIWMFCGLSKCLNSYEASDSTMKRENFELLESLIRNYLKIEQTEENLRVMLIMTVDVLTEWSPKSDIITILWDHFHKKINSAFQIPGQAPQFIAVSNNSANGYLDHIRTQQTSSTKLNPNNTSYSMFVYLVGRIVQKFSADGQKIQIQKFLGRIYTKFPASKLQTLNEMGIHNILRLLLTLAVSTNFQDIGQKLADTLLLIPLDKTTQQQQIVKGHMALMILFRENRMNLTQYTMKFLTQINVVCEKSSCNLVTVLKIIGEAMPIIISNDSFNIGNDLLIDTWIIIYLNSCALAEQDRMFESITKIIQKIQLSPLENVADNVRDFILKLFSIFLPYTRQSFSKSESIWLPELVGNLCLLAYKFERIDGVPKFEHLFREFIDMECSNMANSIKFASVVVENTENIKQIDKTALLQHWIKCSVLLSGSNKELKALTKSIMTLKEFTELCDSAVSCPDEFLDSKEPFCLFIADIGKKYSLSKDLQRSQLMEKFHKYFGTFEKWALPIVQQQQLTSSSSSQLGSKVTATVSDEIVMRIYTFIAITFLHCSEVIYVRSRSSCFFNIAISHFILPGSIMMGLSQPRSTVKAMFKIWHVLIEGITKLDYKNDQHVNKVFTDLIVKWTPLLKISSVAQVVAKPFVNLMNLKKIEVVEFVWAKLGKAYVALNIRKPSLHACLVLTILEELMKVIINDETKMLTVWRSLMVFMIEAAIMSEDNLPSQVICFNLLEKFLKNSNFDTSVDMQQLFLVNVKNYTQRQLSYNSTIYFKFMSKIAKMNPKIVRDLLPFLQSQIRIVEQQRGIANDQSIRSSYESLRISVQNK